MQIIELAIPGVKLVEPVVHRDARGFLMEVWRRDAFATEFVQDNHSLSIAAYTVRGLHFQIPPHAQAKLVRVVRGAVLDVAVDLRHGSPTYGQHVALELSAADRRQLLVPAGCAHGYCTLEPDTEVLYKVDAPYARAAERGLHWRDPALAIAWPVAAADATLSERDEGLPTLAALPEFFRWSAAA